MVQRNNFLGRLLKRFQHQGEEMSSVRNASGSFLKMAPRRRGIWTFYAGPAAGAPVTRPLSRFTAKKVCPRFDLLLAWRINAAWLDDPCAVSETRWVGSSPLKASRSTMKFRPSSTLRGLLACFFFFCMSQQASAAAPLTLQSAFQAAFGQAPPMMRNVRYSDVQVIYTLHPLLLVHLGETSSALIVGEDTSGGYASSGAAAVAYLTWRSGQWRLVRVWYEFVQAGSFGTAFVGYRALYSSMPPLFVGESEDSGAGSVTTWYNLIGLYPRGLVAWGFIHAQGEYNLDLEGMSDSNGYVGCGGYTFSSLISAPKKKGDLMRVTYKGWMMPGGDGEKQRKFLLSADVLLKQGKLSLQPTLEIPNCGD